MTSLEPELAGLGSGTVSIDGGNLLIDLASIFAISFLAYLLCVVRPRNMPKDSTETHLTLLEPQSRFGDKLLEK